MTDFCNPGCPVFNGPVEETSSRASRIGPILSDYIEIIDPDGQCAQILSNGAIKMPAAALLKVAACNRSFSRVKACTCCTHVQSAGLNLHSVISLDSSI